MSQASFEFANQVRGGVGSLGRIDSVEVPLFKQVEDGPELPLDRPRTERLVLDQLNHLREKGVSQKFIYREIHIYSI